MKSAAYVLTACIVLAGLTGCSYESRKTEMYEPGVYKGKNDPLLAQQKQQELIDRFKLVQADR